MLLDCPRGDVVQLLLHAPVLHRPQLCPQLLNLLLDCAAVQGRAVHRQLLGIVALEAVKELDEAVPLVMERRFNHELTDPFLKVIDAFGQVLNHLLGIFVGVHEVVSVTAVTERRIQRIAAASHVSLAASAGTV